MHRELTLKLATKIPVTSRSGHHDPGASGNNQGGNLTNQAITNGQNSIVSRCFGHRHPFLHHTDHKTGTDIDQGNDDSSNGIPFDKLAGTIHSTIEI